MSAFLLLYEMKIKVYMQWIVDRETHKQKLNCICMQSKKRCNSKCERDVMEYNQYQHLEECFKNRPLKRSE